MCNRQIHYGLLHIKSLISIDCILLQIPTDKHTMNADKNLLSEQKGSTFCWWKVFQFYIVYQIWHAKSLEVHVFQVTKILIRLHVYDELIWITLSGFERCNHYFSFVVTVNQIHVWRQSLPRRWNIKSWALQFRDFSKGHYGLIFHTMCFSPQTSRIQELCTSLVRNDSTGPPPSSLIATRRVKSFHRYQSMICGGSLKR